MPPIPTLTELSEKLPIVLIRWAISEDWVEPDGSHEESEKEVRRPN